MSDLAKAPPDVITTEEAQFANATVRKIALRIMWFVMALYFTAIVDRGNISFAALSMNKAIGLNAGMFGIAVGIMFFTYSLFEIPSTYLLARYGARVTLTRIAILWGLATVLMAFTQGPLTLYTFRALLGLAEAGLTPGVMLLVALWFPAHYRASLNAMFNYAIPVAFCCASVISGSILELDGIFGIAGWKWLFIVEGLPAIGLGIFGAFYLTDTPAKATWLTAPEKSWLQTQLARETKTLAAVHADGLIAVLTKPVVILLGLCNFGLFCGLASLFPWLPTILKADGFSNSEIGLIAALPPLVGLIGMIVASRASDRSGERFYFTTGMLVIAAAGYAVAAWATTPAEIVGGFMIASIGAFTAQSVFWTIPQTYLAPAMAPVAIGFIGMLGSMGGALIPYVTGQIRDETGGFAGAFLVIAATLLVSAGLILVVKPTLTPRQSR
jgi:ACS family tartrate transporter-like MFS transporter